MIVAFSTSSPVASVALIVDGAVIASESKLAGYAAAETCLELLSSLLASSGRNLGEAIHFAADLGPGSFIGVRVGVTLAKTLAFNQGVRCFGAPAFDLIGDGTTFLPSRKGQFFLSADGAVSLVDSIPKGAIGYGLDGQTFIYPSACRFAEILPRLVDQSAESLVPHYILEPAISTPKKPYASLP